MTDLRKKVSKIPAHQISKLDTFELLEMAGEFEKFDIKELKDQAAKIELSPDKKKKLIDWLDGFEVNPISTGWHKPPATIR